MGRSFQEAIAARGIPGRAGAGRPPLPPETTGSTAAVDSPSEEVTPSDDLIFDPRTGEVIDNWTTEPSDRLAALVLEHARCEKRLADMRKRIEAELDGRLEALGRKRAVVGDYEIAKQDGSRSRAWDGDELENVLTELVNTGVVTAGEVADIVTRATKVNGTKARDLLNRLDGRAKQALEECFTWETKGRPKLTVTPVAQLEAPKE